MQSKVASLWHMQESQMKTVSEGETEVHEKASQAGRDSSILRSLEQQIPELFAPEDLELEADTTIVEMPTPLELQETPHIEAREANSETAEQDGARDESLNEKQALVKSEATKLDRRSAASSHAFLKQLISGQRTQTALQFWNRHRGDIYLGVAVILVLCVVRWGLWSGPHGKETNTPAAAAATHRKTARDPGLSFLDRVLIQLGLAAAPDPQPDKGNPGVQVWVDLQTALYYCPGTDLYGKTSKGKFTTQRAAQLDQFEPAYRKTCD
jgi:hypothetical protein